MHGHLPAGLHKARKLFYMRKPLLMNRQFKGILRARALMGGPLISLASQVSGLAQLGALLWRFGPTNATDAYFYLFNLGNLPVQILLVGVLYPMLLNSDRITKRGAIRFGFLVPVGALLAVGGGSVWLWLQGRAEADVVAIFVLAALNAVVQARLWYLAVAAEAGGNPKLIAGVALPANALATLVLLLPWPDSASTVTAMMGALLLANAAFAIVITVRRAGSHVLEGLPDIPPRRHAAHWWFLTKSFVSYGGLMVVQSIALILPPAVLTLLSLPMKIVGSVSSTFVNAIMPRLIHQQTDSPDGASRFLRLLALFIGSVSLVGTALGYFIFPAYFQTIVIVGLWLVASASSSVAQRMVFRFLPPSTSKITIIVVPLIVVAVIFSAQSSNFGLVALLCAYALVDATSGFLLLMALRDKVMAPISGVITLLLSYIWLSSLFLL